VARRILRQPQRGLIRGRPATRCGGLLLAVSPTWIAIRSVLLYDMYPWDKPADPGQSSKQHRIPAPRNPAAEKLASENPAAETRATETPATEKPATVTRAAETRATEKPASETPAELAAQALQFALDRRDNGGQVAGRPPAYQTRQ
jgi:hypothetical protein